MNKITSKTFKKTKKIIAERGWRQGLPHDFNEESVCLGVALDEAYGEYFPYAVLEPFIDVTGVSGIVNWNDKKGRTIEDVNNLLDKLIKAYA